jgi:microcystin-dependent protein
MSQPFLGEIKIISWNYAPKGWAFTNGQFLPINQNQALFSLLGTMYGGNGQTTFALPDFRGRVPVHVGQSLNPLGQAAGESTHTLTMSEMTQHLHQAQASNANGDKNFAANNILAAAGNMYGQAINLTPIRPDSVTITGGSQPHENRQPYLVLNFIIALVGIFPSQN